MNPAHPVDPRAELCSTRQLAPRNFYDGLRRPKNVCLANQNLCLNGAELSADEQQNGAVSVVKGATYPRQTLDPEPNPRKTAHHPFRIMYIM